MNLKVIYEPKGRAGEYSKYALNIYNGCDFGCTYCLDRDTLILKEDLSAIKIKDLKIGDKIIGINEENKTSGNLKYTTSVVENIWKTKKEVYEIELENGLKAKCSADHRWLSDRGWKYVIGAETGAMRRPFLTTNNNVRFLGKLYETPIETEDYKKGYISGISRGDAHLGIHGPYTYSRARKDRKNKVYTRTDIQYQYSLRLTDKEAIDRTKSYLFDFGIDTYNFTESGAYGIRNYSKNVYEKIKDIISWNDNSEYMRGFLAGIYDAEGGYDGSSIRIFNSDKEILDFIEKSLKHYNIPYTFDKDSKPANKTVRTIRLLEGKETHICFWQLIDNAISNKKGLINSAVYNQSKVKSIKSLKYEDTLYDIQTSTHNFVANGMISHNCFNPIINKKDKETFHKIITERDNFLTKLESDCVKLTGLTDKVLLCFTCDPYVSLDLETETTRKVLELFKKYNINFQILTKGGSRAKRDFDLYKKGDAFASTLTFTNDEKSKEWEPNAALASDRIETLKYAKSIGIETWVSLEPVVDPAESLKLIELTHDFVDVYKVGTINYNELTDKIDWKDFGLKAIELLEKYGNKYYIKEDLRKYL